jgi:hypothetical protein
MLPSLLIVLAIGLGTLLVAWLVFRWIDAQEKEGP